MARVESADEVEEFQRRHLEEKVVRRGNQQCHQQPVRCVCRVDGRHGEFQVALLVIVVGESRPNGYTHLSMYAM